MTPDSAGRLSAGQSSADQASGGQPFAGQTSALPLLRASGLSRAVDGRSLWSGLSFELHPGDCLVLRGPSGSGKTVLLRTLIGLEPLESGSVDCFGTPRDAWNMPELRSRMILVPQESEPTTNTVEYLLRRPFDLNVMKNRTFETDRARELLQSLGRKSEFLKKEADSLSGGERQIVALVRAVLLQPDILLLDEPTAHLDPDSRDKAENLVADWLDAESGRAAIWTTHDRAQAKRVRRGGSIDLAGA